MDTSISYPEGVPGITTSGTDDRVRTRFVRTLLGYGSGAMYGVHNSSPVNLIRGIAERVLFLADGGKLRPTPKPSPGVYRRLSSVRNQLLEKLVPTPIVAMDKYPELYDGRKREVYQRAYESLCTKPIRVQDSYVSTFVKAEKVNFTAKPDPAPRVIQPRSPRYNLMVGRYLKPLEHGLVDGFRRAWGYSVICKGMNADSVAQQLRENWLAFDDPVAVGLDAHRFDQHVSRDALEFEHGVYNSIFHSKELAGLLKWQLRNKGFGRVGDFLARYTVDGCRMSGDINTGMGNCLLMSLLVLNYFEEYGIRARLTNNGDDCVVICCKKDLPRLRQLEPYFLEFGFRLAIEDPVEVFERIVFCQSQPVQVGDAWRMVRNPWTAMSKDCVSLLPWDTSSQFDTWRAAIGVCGLELTRGVPMWESFYTAIKGQSQRRGGLERVYDSGLGYMATGVRQDVQITAESRYSFWLAFGITPDLQVAIEDSYPDIIYSTNTPMKLNLISQFPTTLACLQNVTSNNAVVPSTVS